MADLGAETKNENDDYPDFAKLVAKKVSLDYENSRGILICGSGAGVDIVANKFVNVRSALAISSDQIYDARHDDNVNVLSIAADFTKKEDAEKIVRTFIATPFAKEERFVRRLDKISQIENTRNIENSKFFARGGSSS